MNTTTVRCLPHIVLVESSMTGAGECVNSYAKQKGYFVTLLTRCGDAYMNELLSGFDQIVTCDTTDFSEIDRVVKTLHAQRGVNAVTTTADFFTPQAARAAESLGLPSMGYEAAAAARNKWMTRNKIAATNPRLNPKYALARTTQEAVAIASDIGFPVVAKPLTLNDGNGVRLMRDVRDLEEYWTTRRRHDDGSFSEGCEVGILLEEFVDAAEFSVETMQPFGKDLELIGVTSKLLTGMRRRHFVEIGHSFPHLRDQELLFRSVAAALDAVGVRCGVVHTECRLRGNKVKIMEINARLAGGKIGSHLIALATGWNPVDAVVEIALGNEPIRGHRGVQGAAIRNIWSRHKATFQSIRNEAEITGMDGVVDVIALLPPGTKVRPPESNADNIAAIITTGRDETVAMARATAAAARIKLDLCS